MLRLACHSQTYEFRCTRLTQLFMDTMCGALICNTAQRGQLLDALLHAQPSTNFKMLPSSEQAAEGSLAAGAAPTSWVSNSGNQTLPSALDVSTSSATRPAELHAFVQRASSNLAGSGAGVSTLKTAGSGCMSDAEPHRDVTRGTPTQQLADAHSRPKSIPTNPALATWDTAYGTPPTGEVSPTSCSGPHGLEVSEAGHHVVSLSATRMEAVGEQAGSKGGNVALGCDGGASGAATGAGAGAGQQTNQQQLTASEQDPSLSHPNGTAAASATASANVTAGAVHGAGAVRASCEIATHEFMSGDGFGPPLRSGVMLPEEVQTVWQTIINTTACQPGNCVTGRLSQAGHCLGRGKGGGGVVGSFGRRRRSACQRDIITSNGVACGGQSRLLGLLGLSLPTAGC